MRVLTRAGLSGTQRVDQRANKQSGLCRADTGEVADTTVSLDVIIFIYTNLKRTDCACPHVSVVITNFLPFKIASM